MTQRRNRTGMRGRPKSRRPLLQGISSVSWDVHQRPLKCSRVPIGDEAVGGKRARFNVETLSDIAAPTVKCSIQGQRTSLRVQDDLVATKGVATHTLLMVCSSGLKVGRTTLK